MALAPTSSRRPEPRVTPEQRRAQAQLMAEQFAALEARADDDPWLANNPLRRLGYRDVGGLEAVDYLPLAPDAATYYGAGYHVGHLEQELALARARGEDVLPIFGSISTMQPDRAAAFDLMESEYLLPPGTIALGPDYMASPIMAHEAGHRGFDVIEELLESDPSLAQRFLDAGLLPRASHGFEEAVVELSDNPSDSWVQPRSEDRPAGATQTMEHTIQYLADPGTAERGRVERFNDIMQQIAEEELGRRGEPPRAQMREPGPGSMFYREPEPEPERGIGALFRRLFGG